MLLTDPMAAGSGWRFPHCPEPPGWELEWDAILRRFEWLHGLASIPQDALYHAEGDVLTHTRSVVEALVRLEEWRKLSAAARSILFTAALFHDLGKLVGTQVEADGRITARNHARRSERMAREILWQGSGLDAPAPFACRESVAKLARLHGLPLWVLDHPAPERAVIEASQTARLDWLALLAEADVRGRVCPDQGGLLDRIGLFRELCRESGCLVSPRRFADDHSRVLFFQRPDRRPDDRAYDDTCFEVVLMSGLPGAGKDTWVRQNLPGWPVISLDRIRAELQVQADEEQSPVIRVAKERARELLRTRQPFIWNATNVTVMIRRQLIDRFFSYQARVRIVYVEAPYRELMRRNRRRPAPVPEPVLVRLIDKLEIPDPTEAHAVEWVCE